MKTHIQILTALLLLTACHPNTPSALSVKGKIYKHPTAVQYLKFATDSVCYYGDFGNEALNNQTFAYTQKDEVVTVFTPTPEHLLAYEGFVERGNTIYELFADTTDPDYQDHQPQDPKAFSLVGKRYWTQWNSTIKDTLEFVTDSTGGRFSRPATSETSFTYVLNYPALTLTFGTNDTHLSFTDTATIVCKGWECTYYLVP